MAAPVSLQPWPQLWEKVRPQLELKGEGRPDGRGWVLARCVEPQNHRNGDAHFSLRINVKTGGVRCMSQGCRIGPNLNSLAEHLGLRGRAASEGRPCPEDAVRRLAEERRLPEEELRTRYGVRAVSGGWAFPVDDPDASGHPHMKRDPKIWPAEDAPKNWWPKNSHVSAKDLVYGLTHVIDSRESVYVAAGEIDCITLQLAGYAAVSFLAGEGTVPSAKAIRKLTDRGVRSLWIVYDSDEAGSEGAQSTASACAQYGLDVSIVALPAEVGEKGDINDLWRLCGGDRDRFVAALEACSSSSYSPKSLGSESIRRILRTFGEFVETAQQAATTEYLVDGLFPSDWLLGIAGKPRVGKSLLALDLARCVATGRPFLGRRTKQGPVIYLALEDPPSLVLDRIRALGAVPDAYIYLGPWGQTVQDEVERDVRAIRPALIVIDPLVATYGTAVQDEADNAALAAHMARLYALGQEVGASVLAVHHQRKADGPAGDTIRGGSAILAAVHCMVVATGSPERLKLTFLTKTLPIDPMTVAMGDGLSWQVADHEIRAPTTEDSVIFALRELKKASAARLTEFLGISRSAVNAALAKLGSQNRVVVVAKQGRAPVYAERTDREMQVPLSELVPGGVRQESGGVD